MRRDGFKVCLATVLLLTALFVISGCGGGGGGGGGNGGSSGSLTPEQLASINQVSQAITTKLRSATDPSSETVLNEAKDFARSQPNVEDATVSDGELVVKYKEAGFQVWTGEDPADTPPADIEELRALTRSIAARATQTRAPVGTKKAVIINTFSEDPNRAVRLAYFQEIKTILESEGFDVLVLTERTATPDVLRGLADRSLILHSGHGGGGQVQDSVTSPYFVMAGKWKDDYARDWQANRIVKLTSVDDRGDFFGTTGKFWREAYSSRRFNHALFMNLACSSSKYEDYRNCLFAAGVAAYTGWSEPQGKAVFSAWRILAMMADEKTLQQAVDSLPNWYLTDGESSLWYGPDNARDITLGGLVQQGPQIIITAPTDSETIIDRQCEVRGRIEPWSDTMQASVSVNGQSTAFEPNFDGYFDQPVGLRAGPNLIRVSVIGTQENSSEVSVNGQFSSDILYTTLWWKTNYNDLDLHLKPISGADGATAECYWSNKTPSWGAALDVDDRNGFGPEHITARSLPSGTYKLYVHYYDKHGQTDPVVVNVAVSTNGQPSKIFSLNTERRMTTVGDEWDVCTIEYPSGRIGSLDDFIPASRARSLMVFPRK